jgi:hypothetical protein
VEDQRRSNDVERARLEGERRRDVGNMELRSRTDSLACALDQPRIEIDPDHARAARDE